MVMSENNTQSESRRKEGGITKFVRKLKHKPLLLVALVALAGGVIGAVATSAAKGDCGDNSIVRCGAFSSNGSGPNQVNFNANVRSYHDGNEVDKIFDHYGIDDRNLGSLPLGEVRIDGTIWLNGKMVATNAKSTGRHNISNNNGSSRRVDIAPGVVVYERAPKVSFRQNSLQAWVKLDANGKFKYAVITSCGNPTTATPTYTPPPPPAPTGAVKCTSISVDKLDRSRFKFNVTASKSGQAGYKGFIISYGDGANGSSNSTNGRASFEKTYSKPGTYKIQAGALGVLAGRTIGDGGASCATTITVSPPPATPSYTIKKYVNGADAQDQNSAVTVKANEQFEYRVVVENTGSVNLTNVKVWDILPGGVSYVDNTLLLGGKAVPNDSDFFVASKGIIVPSILAKSTAVFTMKAVVKAEAGTVADKCTEAGKFYNNVAKADPEGTGEGLGEKTDPAAIRCKEIPEVKEPAVDIEKDVSKYVVGLNEEFEWRLTVRNTGNQDLANVKVSDNAPESVEFTSHVEHSGVTVTMTPKTYNATIASLKKGEVKTLVIKSKVVKEVVGEIVNTACVDATEVTDQGDDPTKDDCDDAKITLEEEKCPVPGKENLPKGDPACETEECPIPGLEMYDASSPLCKSIPTTPNEVPSTGGGELILMSVLALGVGGATYAYMIKGGAKKA